jgi:hypothetical protein
MHISFTLARLPQWPHAVLSYNCAAVQDPTVDSMSAISSPVNTPIGALVTGVVVDDIVPRASNVTVGGVALYASLASLANTVPSGRSWASPSPYVHDTWTPHDAAVGNSVGQPPRSLLQPQQLARDLYIIQNYSEFKLDLNLTVPPDRPGTCYHWMCSGSYKNGPLMASQQIAEMTGHQMCLGSYKNGPLMASQQIVETTGHGKPSWWQSRPGLLQQKRRLLLRRICHSLVYLVDDIEAIVLE